jgi:hypothetical protein
MEKTSRQWLDGCSKELIDGWLQAGNVWLDVEKKLIYDWLRTTIMAGYDLRMDGCT